MENLNTFQSELVMNDLYDISAKEYVEEIKKINTVIIWGTGSAGQFVFDFLKKFGVERNVKYFADNNKAKWGTNKNGVAIISPEEVVQVVAKDSDSSIILASEYLAIVRKQLLSLGIEDNNIDMRGLGLTKDFFYFEKESPFKIISSHLSDFEKTYSYLSDEKSKKVFMGLLNSKISLDSKYLVGIADPMQDQYFDKDLITLAEDEVFCDCGSYNGDTLENFIALSGSKYKKYIAIEADKSTCAELEKKVKENAYHNIQIQNVACWNEKVTLKFQSAQTAGHITEDGDISVQADRLDNILNNEKVTFIKMDIEGAEEMALKGASKSIQENKPILAICIYHNLEDFYKIPLIIKNLYSEYKLYVRHYRDMFDTETVCYAIPKERLA